MCGDNNIWVYWNFLIWNFFESIHADQHWEIQNGCLFWLRPLRLKSHYDCPRHTFFFFSFYYSIMFIVLCPFDFDFWLQACRYYLKLASTTAMLIQLEMLVWISWKTVGAQPWRSQRCYLHSDQYLPTLPLVSTFNLQTFLFGPKKKNTHEVVPLFSVYKCCCCGSSLYHFATCYAYKAVPLMWRILPHCWLIYTMCLDFLAFDLLSQY